MLLTSAIAYRHDFRNRVLWEHRREEAISVVCPRCLIEYELMVSALAGDDEIGRWLDLLHARMDRVCPHHEVLIQF